MSGDGWFRAGTVDRVRDVVIRRPLQYAGGQTITIVEGLFLLRDELVDWWDFSVFLDVDTDAALARKGRRDGLVLDPANPMTPRYVEGQEDLRGGLPATGARDMGPRQRRLEGSPTRRLIRAHRHDRTLGQSGIKRSTAQRRPLP